MSYTSSPGDFGAYCKDFDKRLCDCAKKSNNGDDYRSCCTTDACPTSCGNSIDCGLNCEDMGPPSSCYNVGPNDPIFPCQSCTGTGKTSSKQSTHHWGVL